MAFSMMPQGSDPEESPLAEINVTPLVDVMLVLLIIFMIAAPMLHPGVEVQLPQAEAKSLPLRVENPLVLSLHENGLVYMQERPIHPSNLVEELLPILEARGDDSLFLKADRRLPYGQVMEILVLLNQGGIEQVGMVTEPPRGERGSGQRESG